MLRAERVFSQAYERPEERIGTRHDQDGFLVSNIRFAFDESPFPAEGKRALIIYNNSMHNSIQQYDDFIGKIHYKTEVCMSVDLNS